MADPVQVRKGVWRYRVEGTPDPITGKRRQHRGTFYGGKKGALDAQAKLRAEVAGGKYSGAEMTVGDLLNRWYAHASPDLSPSTRESTRIVIDHHLIPHLGDTQLAKLRTADIDATYSLLRASGSKKGEALAPATVKRAHGILRRALGQAVRWEWLAVNPASSASPPKVPASPIQPPSPETVQRLIAKADDDFAPLLRLAVVTGARRGELCGLRWADIGSTVRFRSGVVSVKGRLVVKEPKETASIRTVALDPETVQVLEHHKLRVAERALALGVVLDGESFVFPGDPTCRTPLRPDGVSHRFERLCKAMGVKVRFHDLRHFAATELIGAGVDIRTVAGRLGHAGGGRTTLAVYAHFQQARDQDAAKVLAGVISRTTPARRRSGRR